MYRYCPVLNVNEVYIHSKINMSGDVVPYYTVTTSGVARTLLSGRAAHPEDQNEEENEENLRKNERNYRKMKKDWGNVLILPTQEWGAGSGPGYCTGTYTEVTVLLLWGNSAVTMEYPHSYSVGVPASKKQYS